MWVYNYHSDPDHLVQEVPFVKITYLSFTDNLPAWSYSYHHHESIYELTFIVEGSGMLCLENDKIRLEAGDIVIMPPQTLHCYACQNQEYMHYYSLWVDIRGCRGMLAQFLDEIREEPVLVSAHKYLNYILSVFRILAELHQINGGVIEETYQSICLGLFMLIRKIYQHRAMVVPVGPSSYASDVLWYINQHYQEDLSLESLARQFHISASHLRRIFKQVYEISPITYLIKRRIAIATDYLLKTDLSVTEVARQVGYENVTHFSHLFAARIGCTPSQFRERNQTPPVLGTHRQSEKQGRRRGPANSQGNS